MSVFTQGNLMQAFVVKSGTSGTVPATNADLLSTLADSQVVAVGKPMNGSFEQVIQPGSSAGTYDYFRLVQRTLDPSGASLLNYGPVVRLANNIVVSAATRAYVAPSEQLYYIGYNGQSGSLDVSQSNEFILTIAYDHDDMMWSEQKLRNSYDYYSIAPTQQGLATSMATQINYKEQLGVVNGTGRMVSAEIMNNAATTSVSSFGGGLTASVIQGSDIITVSGAFSASIVAGTALRLGSDALTSPIYFVTAINNNATPSTTTGLPARGIRLNMPYQGATNATLNVTGSVGNSGFIAAGSLGTSWGIRITGQPLTFTRDFFKYNKVKFHFDLKNFGASQYDRPGNLNNAGTGATDAKESYKGVGSWQEVSEYESFSFGNEGALNRMVIPIPPVRGYTSSSNNYDTIAIANTDNTFTSNSSMNAGIAPMRMQQFVFIPTSGAVRTSLASQLNNLLGASL